MRLPRKLTLMTTSMFVAPLALSVAHAQSADDLNADALADFRTGADEMLYDGSDLDPRGEGDMEAAAKPKAGASAEAADMNYLDATGETAEEAWEDTKDAAEDAADSVGDAAEETGEWMEDVGDDVGDDLEEAGEETGDWMEEAADNADDAMDDADDEADDMADDIEDQLEETDEPY